MEKMNKLNQVLDSQTLRRVDAVGFNLLWDLLTKNTI